MIEEVVEAWDGTLCATRFDRDTETFFAIAVHSRDRGPAAGGTRAMQYPSHRAAVEDATRLASAMTYKMVAADLPMGGGKSVIGLPRPRHQLDDDHWRRILEIHADNLATLNGSYWTGPDIGTSSADMDVLHSLSGGRAFGRSEGVGGPGSSAPATAYGVYVSLRTAARAAGLDSLTGRRVLIQGLGAVGMGVFELARKDDADLVVTDVDPRRCDEASALGAAVVPSEHVFDVESDVFVPCAVGGVIDVPVARMIRTSVVAGAANNVLAEPAAGDELFRRGIVFAPDFVANGGGAIHLIGREVLGWTPEQVSAHVEQIAATLEEVFRVSAERRISTDAAARLLVEQRLES